MMRDPITERLDLIANRLLTGFTVLVDFSLAHSALGSDNSENPLP